MDTQVRNGRLRLFGRRDQGSSSGTSREVLAKLDSLSAYSTLKLLASKSTLSTLETENMLSLISASIEMEDLASTSPALHKMLSSLLKNSSAYQDPVPFMRLPPEIRVMIYERTWTVVDCPWIMTVRAGRRGNGNRHATSIEYWLGPSPERQVQYPKVIMLMDPRIKNEFAHELCAKFPVQIYASGLFTELIPGLSIHNPSVFLDHLQDCQIQYLPRFLNDPGSIINVSNNRAIFRADLTRLVELSLHFPSVKKMVVHIPLGYPALFSQGITAKYISETLVAALTEEADTESESESESDEPPCWHFCGHTNNAFIMGWHTGEIPSSIENSYICSICTALSMESHDAASCTSVRCQYTAFIAGPRRSFTRIRAAGMRLFHHALQWADIYLEEIITLAIITAAFLIWLYRESLTTLFQRAS